MKLNANDISDEGLNLPKGIEIKKGTGLTDLQNRRIRDSVISESSGGCIEERELKMSGESRLRKKGSNRMNRSR